MHKITYPGTLLNEEEGDTLTQQLSILVKEVYEHRINKTQNFRLNVAGYVVYPLVDDEKALQPITIQVDQSSGNTHDGPQAHPDQTCLKKILKNLIEKKIFTQKTRKLNGQITQLKDPSEYANEFKKLVNGEACDDGKKYFMLFFSERHPCTTITNQFVLETSSQKPCYKYIIDTLGNGFLPYIYYLTLGGNKSDAMIKAQFNEAKEAKESKRDTKTDQQNQNISPSITEKDVNEEYYINLSSDEEEAWAEAEEELDRKAREPKRDIKTDQQNQNISPSVTEKNVNAEYYINPSSDQKRAMRKVERDLEGEEEKSPQLDEEDFEFSSNEEKAMREVEKDLEKEKSPQLNKEEDGPQKKLKIGNSLILGNDKPREEKNEKKMADNVLNNPSTSLFFSKPPKNPASTSSSPTPNPKPPKGP